MFEFIAAVTGLTIASWAILIAIASSLFPIFWVWMLVDSILRNDAQYPGSGANEKIVWVLLIALVQFVAVFYFFMVYRGAKRVPSETSAMVPGTAAC